MPFESYKDLAKSIGRVSNIPDLPVVCIQGLGFVGVAMAIAVAAARDANGKPYFNVIGVDLDSPEGQAKVDAINSGKMPIANSDTQMNLALADATRAGNLLATTEADAYKIASVAVVDIHLDVCMDGVHPTVDFENFRAAIRALGERMPIGSLVVVETTVPPGTCAEVVAPELSKALKTRGLTADSLMLAHAYERVMPGHEYLSSVNDFWRVYAGHTEKAADACGDFLSKIINVRDFPLVRLMSTTASETAKVLENTYRAVNIAFMEEWGRFAESVGIDIFEIVEAIRMRPTHNNIRQPGFGVGGYCLPKDPYLASIGARELFGIRALDFDFSHRAAQKNMTMPLVSLNKIQKLLGGELKGKRLLLLGVSYRPDVGDTRYGPSETFVLEAEARGAIVRCHDPLVRDWKELERQLPSKIPDVKGFDAVVFAVPHGTYKELDVGSWVGSARPLVFDADNVLSRSQRHALRGRGCRVVSIGRGENCD